MRKEKVTFCCHLWLWKIHIFLSYLFLCGDSTLRWKFFFTRGRCVNDLAMTPSPFLFLQCVFTESWKLNNTLRDWNVTRCQREKMLTHTVCFSPGNGCNFFISQPEKQVYLFILLFCLVKNLHCTLYVRCWVLFYVFL